MINVKRYADTCTNSWNKALYFLTKIAIFLKEVGQTYLQRHEIEHNDKLYMHANPHACICANSRIMVRLLIYIFSVRIDTFIMVGRYMYTDKQMMHANVIFVPGQALELWPFVAKQKKIYHFSVQRGFLAVVGRAEKKYFVRLYTISY